MTANRTSVGRSPTRLGARACGTLALRTLALGALALLALPSGGSAWGDEELLRPPPEPTPTGMHPRFATDGRMRPRPTRAHLIDIQGTWQFRGPGPTRNGQTEGIAFNPVIGAIHGLAVHPTNADIMYVGTVNGGIWRTNNATAVNPSWTPQSDRAASLSISEIEFDPLDGAFNTLLAGIGRYSSIGGQGGALPGLLRTTNGGNTWSLISHALLNGRSISSVAARGPVLLAAAAARQSFAGGMFRSIDTGLTWERVSDRAGSGLPLGDVFDLVADPSNLNRFYCSVQSIGLFRSNDLGFTWSSITAGDPLIGPVITAVSNNNTEMAATATGRLYANVNLNGQARFIGFTDNPTAGAPTWTAMDLPRTSEALGLGISNATNASPIVITTVAGHGLNTGSGVIIAGVLGNTAANGTFNTVTRLNATQFSLDGTTGNGAYGGGGTVANRIIGLQPRDKPGSQGATHNSLAADPASPTTIYMGGDRQDSPFPNFIGALDFSGRLWRGDTTVAPTGGIPSPQWEHLTHATGIGAIPAGGTAGTSAPHADSREIEFDALGRLIQVDDGGIYRRDSALDNTGDWVSLIGNLGVGQFHETAYDSLNDVVYGATQDTGTVFQTTVGSATWSSVPDTLFGGFFLGDGGVAACDDINVLPNSLRWASGQNFVQPRQQTWDNTNAVVAETTQAFNWVNPGAPPNDNTFRPDFYGTFDVSYLPGGAGANRLVIAGSNGVFVSTDLGANITRVSTVACGDGLGLDPVVYGGRTGGVDNPDVLWFGGRDGNVYLKTTAGAAPQAAALPAYPGGFPRDVSIDTDDWTHAFVCDATNVWRTPDQGATWTNVTGNLLSFGANTLFSLAFVNDAVADGIVVGTDQGVFVARANNWTNWVPLGTGLPFSLLYDLEYDPATDTLMAGTLGRGAWTLPNVTAALDGTPPVVTCTLRKRVLWPANRGMQIVGLTVTATDNFDPPTALARSFSVTSDEAAGAAPFSPDGTFAVPSTVRLRSERVVLAPFSPPGGRGRVYLFGARAQDVAGNVGVGACTSIVPHNATVGHLTALLLEAATVEANFIGSGGVPPVGYANAILPVTNLP